MNIKCSAYKKHKISSQGLIRRQNDTKSGTSIINDNAHKTKGVLQYSAVWKKVLTQKDKKQNGASVKASNYFSITHIPLQQN